MPNGKGDNRMQGNLNEQKPHNSSSSYSSTYNKQDTEPYRPRSELSDDSKYSLPKISPSLEYTMPNGKGDNRMQGNLNERKKPHNSSSSYSSTYNKQDTEPYRPRSELSGYYGLYNLGATCYLNAVLQALFMTKQFRQAVESLVPEKSATVAVLLRNLFQNLKKGTACVGNDLLTNLGINNKCEQQDAAEFFQKIVNLCNIPKIYHGRLRNSTKCLKDGQESASECGSFVILPLAIESDQSYTVVDGWKKFFEPSILDGDNQLYCDFCDEKTDAETVCVLDRHPEVLTLQLKRFYFDYNYMKYMKNNCAVEIPLQLVSQEYTYELYAIIKHSGSLKYGHYYTIIKSFQDGYWYRFNDSRVTQDSPKINDKKTIISQSAYVLMYNKRSGGNGHRQGGQSDAEAGGQGAADRFDIPESNDIVEKSGGNISAENCTDAGSKGSKVTDIAMGNTGGKGGAERHPIPDLTGDSLDAEKGVFINNTDTDPITRSNDIGEYSGDDISAENCTDAGSKGSKVTDIAMGNTGGKGGAERHAIPDLTGDNLDAEKGVFINNTDTDPITRSNDIGEYSGDDISAENCTDAGSKGSKVTDIAMGNTGGKGGAESLF